MTKLKPFLVEYEEVQKQSYIVYAEDEEQASEIMTEKAFNDGLDLNNLEFDHWNVDVMREAKDKDLEYYDTVNEKQMEGEREK